MSLFDIDALLEDLRGDSDPSPAHPDDEPIVPSARELVVDKHSGHVRQAGASQVEGTWIATKVKPRAERSLYYFCKAILDQYWLTPALHRPLCQFLTSFRKPHRRRKLVLYPREHGKTSIVGHALSPHILIQPAATNIYFPGQEGCDARILLSGESEQRAMDAMRVITSHLETNDVLRALWPHRVWDNPRRQSKKWNDTEIIVPRAREFPDPSIRAIGVGGAITGAHPSVIIKDDLATLKAANSITTMQGVIEWHIASRALIAGKTVGGGGVTPLEFIIGTRWHVADLYDHIIQHDKSVEVMIRAMVEDGKIIYPEHFTWESIAELQAPVSEGGFGPLFPLLYMNDPKDVQLVDLPSPRLFDIIDDIVMFDDDARDPAINALMTTPRTPPPDPTRGMPLNHETWGDIFDHREAYFRARAE